MCFAHSKNVRVVLAGNFPVANLTNDAQRQAWQQDMVQRVQDLHADGINFDIEEPIAASSPEQKLLVTLVNDTRNALLAINQHYQVTFDVAWSPDCIDGRCYDVVALSKVTDFLAVMSYDERSQIFPPAPCVAGANSPYTNTVVGIGSYLLLNISASRLVLGQPWYGYDYPCETINPTTLVCTTKRVPFRGANCSDASGVEMSFAWIMKKLKSSTTGLRWDEKSKAPFFDYTGTDNKTHQVWFDNVQSLSLKYALVQTLQLRGVAFWTVDYLDYNGDDEGKAQAKAMWAAIDVHL